MYVRSKLVEWKDKVAENENMQINYKLMQLQAKWSIVSQYLRY